MKNLDIESLVKNNVKLTYKIKNQLLKGKLNDFGNSLDKAWESKRKFSSKISSAEIDNIYKEAKSNGAIGGKLLGAGGGGYFMFFVESLSKNSFLRSMRQRGFNATRFQFDDKGMQSWTMRDA